LTSLGALRADEARPVIDLLAKAKINVVALPATDVYLSSAEDPVHPRRGLTPIRALREAGVNVAYSSNNIRNAFTPFGTADPLQIGLLLAHVAQLGSPGDRDFVLEMCTHAAARVLGIADRYGVAIGRQADLVILDTHKVGDALLDLPARLWVIKRGRVAVETRHTSNIYRTPQKGAAL
jgi:cytosine deaminase